MRALVHLVLLAVLTACASAPATGPRFTALTAISNDRANIYILRPHNDFGRGVWPNILFNGTKVAGLPDSTYTLVQALPGAYAISTEKSQLVSGGWNIKGDIQVEGGKAYFLMLSRETKKVSTLMPVGAAFIPSNGTQISWEGWVPLDIRDAEPMLTNLDFVKPQIELLMK
jgi:Protein of unknown function (DUF2846)